MKLEKPSPSDFGERKDATEYEPDWGKYRGLKGQADCSEKTTLPYVGYSFHKSLVTRAFAGKNVGDDFESTGQTVTGTPEES